MAPMPVTLSEIESHFCYF